MWLIAKLGNWIVAALLTATVIVATVMLLTDDKSAATVYGTGMNVGGKALGISVEGVPIGIQGIRDGQKIMDRAMSQHNAGTKGSSSW